MRANFRIPHLSHVVEEDHLPGELRGDPGGPAILGPVWERGPKVAAETTPENQAQSEPDTPAEQGRSRVAQRERQPPEEECAGRPGPQRCTSSARGPNCGPPLQAPPAALAATQRRSEAKGGYLTTLGAATPKLDTVGTDPVSAGRSPPADLCEALPFLQKNCAGAGGRPAGRAACQPPEGLQRALRPGEARREPGPLAELRWWAGRGLERARPTRSSPTSACSWRRR